MTSEAPAAGDAAASNDAAVPPQPAIDDVAPPRAALAGAGAAVTGAGAAVEIGGRNGPEPTRYGDWEMRGRCIDF